MKMLKSYKLTILALTVVSSLASYSKLDLLKIENFCSQLIVFDKECVNTLIQCIGNDVYTFDDCQEEYLTEELLSE